MSPLFAFLNIGPMEWIIIGVIAILLFGKNLPNVARSLGKSMVEFKKGVKGLEDDLDGSMARHDAPAALDFQYPPLRQQRALSWPATDERNHQVWDDRIQSRVW